VATDHSAVLRLLAGSVVVLGVTGVVLLAVGEYLVHVGFGPHLDAAHDVVHAAVLQERGVALVRDGGLFVGVRPGAGPAEERGITVRVLVSEPDGARLAGLLEATASGHLPARVHAVVPLDQAAAAHRAVAKGGVRGRYVLQP
jgi:NADPH:quinone reductase-like Zn-dependent oxidoreductase